MTPEVADQLWKAGAGPLLVLVVALIIIGAFREWWVPGWLYRKMEARADKAELQAERTVEALDKNTEALEKVLAEAARRERASTRSAGGRTG